LASVALLLAIAAPSGWSRARSASAGATVLTVTAMACYLPARRTLRVQPTVVLKSE
jgi:ABC-type lipoprotein release transport system permease subunit